MLLTQSSEDRLILAESTVSQKFDPMIVKRIIEEDDDPKDLGTTVSRSRSVEKPKVTAPLR